MRFFRQLISAFALTTAAVAAPSLTGLWHAKFTEPGGAKRELHLALRADGQKLHGDVETPTRRASLVEGTASADGFKAIAESMWDGQLARRPIEGRLDGDVLHVRVQAWPEGPMASYDLRRVSGIPSIPRLRALPLPELIDIPADGLAKTPPMGWNSWNKFGCRIDDRTIRAMADAVVESGLKAAGYEYVNIDDCWQGERDREGNIQADAKRFPDMKALADYVHSKGLKIGIYSSPGPRTCAGYEGSYGHEAQDARTYAAWGIDFLKYDWCSAGKIYSDEDMRPAFQKMGAALKATGRPIVYSICQYGLADVWTWGQKAGGHLWRTTTDIGDNWRSVSGIAFGRQIELQKFSGPGRWNDPDMLEVGNGGMTADEYRSHITAWAMLSAPLLAGNDLRSMTAETRAMLTKREIILIDQDPFARPATRNYKKGAAEVWTKPLHDGSLAVAIFNQSDTADQFSAPWEDLGVEKRPASVQDVWGGKQVSTAGQNCEVALPPHGVALLIVR